MTHAVDWLTQIGFGTGKPHPQCVDPRDAGNGNAGARRKSRPPLAPPQAGNAKTTLSPSRLLPPSTQFLFFHIFPVSSPPSHPAASSVLTRPPPRLRFKPKIFPPPPHLPNLPFPPSSSSSSFPPNDLPYFFCFPPPLLRLVSDLNQSTNQSLPLSIDSAAAREHAPNRHLPPLPASENPSAPSPSHGGPERRRGRERSGGRPCSGEILRSACLFFCSFWGEGGGVLGVGFRLVRPLPVVPCVVRLVAVFFFLGLLRTRF